MYTDHAKIRMQQRGIPPLIVEWLVEYGARVYDHHGARIRYFDRNVWKQLGRQKGETVLRRLDAFRDAYLVEAVDGDIVTVGHNYKRIWRH